MAGTKYAFVLGLAVALTALPVSAGKGGGKDRGPVNPVLLISSGNLAHDAVTATDADGNNKQSIRGITQGSWSADGRFAAFYAPWVGSQCPGTGRAVGIVELLDPASNTWGDTLYLACIERGSAAPAFSPVMVGGIYTLAYFDPMGARLSTDGGQKEEIQILQFQETALGIEIVSGPTNITDTPEVDEVIPTWAPDGAEFAVITYEGSDQDLVAYSGDGSTAQSLIVEPGLFQGQEVGLGGGWGGPDWSRTNQNMIAVALSINGSPLDIWCIDRGKEASDPAAAVNLTQHLGGDPPEGNLSWLPDDRGIVFVRGKEVWEITFNNYDPGWGCPLFPADSTARRLLRRVSGGDFTRVVDYLRFDWPAQ